MKPVKIRLSQGDLRAQGMYILLEENEEKYTKNGITSPPNRTYKIEIAVETVVNNKRCRGKRSFNIPKGTSITKAIESLLGKKDELIKTLKDKGSLKIKKIVIDKKDTKSRVLNDLFDLWINKKKINKKPNTVRVYSVYYNAHVKDNIGKKIIDDITEHDIQIEVINTMVNANLGGNTIQGMKRILKPLFEENQNKQITIKDIIEKVSIRYESSPDLIVSKNRHNSIIMPRFVAIYLSTQLTNLTTIEIGKEFGKRDHSTVINARKNIESMLKEDDSLREVIEEIKSELKS